MQSASEVLARAQLRATDVKIEEGRDGGGGGGTGTAG
jgi:hypothetical protein